MNQRELGRVIAAQIYKKGYSVEGFARSIHMNSTHLYRLIHSEHSPRVDTILRIQNALGIKIIIINPELK